MLLPPLRTLVEPTISDLRRLKGEQRCLSTHLNEGLDYN